MNHISYESHHEIERYFPFVFHTDIVSSCHCTPNWHTNMEFLCCIQGQGVVKCETTEYDFSPGDIIAINTDTLHMVSSNTNVVYHCLIVDNVFFHQNDLMIDNLFFQEYIQDPNLFLAFDKIAQAFSIHGALRNATINHAILGFFLLLWRKYTIDRPASHQNTLSSERIKHTLRYINKNYSSKLTLDKIAFAIGVSKYYLSHEFKKITGHTVFEMIIMIRCRQAKRLLQDGSSVSNAARSCGFENMSYFTRAYRKYIGTLPSQDVKS